MLNASGDLLIADASNHRIRLVDLNTGLITTVAGSPSTPGVGAFSDDGGLATAAELNSPREVAFDATGNFFIADGFNNRIRRVDASAGLITTVVGEGTLGFGGDGGPATAAQLAVPTSIAFDAAGSLFIADLANQLIRRVDVASNVITTVAGQPSLFGFDGDGVPAAGSRLGFPIAVAIGADGELLIAELFNHRIRRVVFPATIIVVVHSGGGDQRFAFSAPLLGGFALTRAGGTATRTFANLDAGTYNLAEFVPFGWELTGASCDNGLPPSQLVLGAGKTVTCTFSNVDIDADDDGLTDDREALFWTDPFNPDTDGDGVEDGRELLIDNTDPRDPINGAGDAGAGGEQPGLTGPPLRDHRL